MKPARFTEEEIQSDPVLIGMARDSIPLTRDNYIVRNWGTAPEPWSAELEAQLPEKFQNWSQFDPKDRQ